MQYDHSPAPTLISVIQIYSHEILGFIHWRNNGIFTGCYFLSVKISSVNSGNNQLWLHVKYCMQCLQFERNIIKNQRKCNKQKNHFDVEYEIYFTHETIFFKYFQEFEELLKISKILSYSLNKFHIQCPIIVHPLSTCHKTSLKSLLVTHTYSMDNLKYFTHLEKNIPTNYLVKSMKQYRK